MQIENRGLDALDLSASTIPPGESLKMGEGLLKVVTATHPLDAALSVHNPLLTRVEGVTLAAHFDAERGLGRACVEHVATGAGHRGVVEMGVNICFHYLPVYLLIFILRRTARIRRLPTGTH